jgi:hypothetical protein
MSAERANAETRHRHTHEQQADGANAAAWKRTEADWEWLRRHPEVFSEHAGRWICVVDQEVVLSEEDHGTFQRRLEAGGYRQSTPLIMRLPAVAEWAATRVS